MSAREALLKAFDLQVGWCREHGSPFTSDLIAAMTADLEAGGPVASLVQDWPGDPLPDAVSLRLAGALHAAALSGRDLALQAAYPAADPSWRMTRVWPRARAFLAREAQWVHAFIANAPQTNETRRTIALLPGFLRAAQGGPLSLLEIGASAGLNLHWDQFRFETESWSFGPRDGPLIDTDWRAPTPEGLDGTVAIVSRKGCDVNPLDVSDPHQRIRLTAYVWPDQPDRLARIDRAIALSFRSGVRPEKMDAASFLVRELAAPLTQGTTVIFHSVVWQYLPEQTKAGVRAAIAAAAKSASPTRRLAWLRYEPSGWDLDMSATRAFDGFTVSMALWPGPDGHRMFQTDGHTRVVLPAPS